MRQPRHRLMRRTRQTAHDHLPLEKKQPDMPTAPSGAASLMAITNQQTGVAKSVSAVRNAG